MSHITNTCIALAAIITASGCNASMNDAYQRQLQDRDQRIEKMEREAKQRDAKLNRLEKRRANARQVAEETLAEVKEEQKQNAEPSPLLPGPGAATPGEPPAQLAAFSSALAFNQTACTRGMTGPYVAHAGQTPGGSSVHAMAINQPTECRGNCLVLRNHTSGYLGVRMTAANYSGLPGPNGRDSAVTICNGQTPLPPTRVVGPNGVPVFTTLLPPANPPGSAQEVALVDMVGGASILLVQYGPMPRGSRVPWPVVAQRRIDLPLPFPIAHARTGTKVDIRFIGPV